MKKQIQNNSNAGQSATEVRKSQKHDANLQKNSTLYFQVGLILCLLGTFALFEMQFERTILKPETAEIDTTTIDYQMEEVKVYKPEEKKVLKKEVSTKLIDKYIEKEDTFEELIEKTIITPEENTTPDKPIDESGFIVEEGPEENIYVENVQFVPIFPGCEKFDLNSERKKCLNEKMTKLVQRKFNTDIASNHGLTGVQRIFVEFKVDKTGQITDIKTRAPHPKLEEEANRIANKIPNMKPGKNGTTPVNVIYNLPIKFKVQD